MKNIVWVMIIIIFLVIGIFGGLYFGDKFLEEGETFTAYIIEVNDYFNIRVYVSDNSQLRNIRGVAQEFGQHDIDTVDILLLEITDSLLKSFDTIGNVRFIKSDGTIYDSLAF